LPSRWRPHGIEGDLYERLHTQFEAQAWAVGRVTGQEFAKAKAYPSTAAERHPRKPWFARAGAGGYAVVFDAHGKIAWGRSDIGGDPIVVVLTEAVSDAHLAGLRDDGVSYFFAGESAIDMVHALEFLNRELRVQRLLLEGGGALNGSLLRAGLIDEVSLIIWPAIDGAAGAPCIFDSIPEDASKLAPLRDMKLFHTEHMSGGALWLRYSLDNEER
jgi:riboflavin biosynthesis pyrimidine reductase